MIAFARFTGEENPKLLVAKVISVGPGIADEAGKITVSRLLRQTEVKN
jgi:hypothetical protein